MSDIIEKPMHLKKFQSAFYESKARFPCFVAGWGTGKTMTAILKGILLSQVYKNNLGLIVRKKFTDLRDSTLKDFERYTGLKVPQSTKEVTIPGTKSVIMFRHGEELSGLQNVNLGWVYIEQAEEFDTAEQFDMIRGRMRRELEPDKSFEVPKNHYYRPYIEWLRENPLRQLMVGANTNGHNWNWRRWKKSPKNEYELHEAVTWDNQENLPNDFIEDLKALKNDSVKKFNRFVLNSWEDYDMEGAYYAALMSDALKDKRVECHNLIDKNAPVYTFWDLGLRASDTTAIWFVQFVKNQIWLIDYYENYGEGMEFYNNILNEKAYNYSQHWLPPDAKQRIQGKTVTTRADIMREYRLPKHEKIEIVTPHSREDRIEYTRKIIHSCWFSDKCVEGVDALNHYKTEPQENLSTEGKPSLKPQPLHNWASNGADAFGYMAVSISEKLIQGLMMEDKILPNIEPYRDHPRHAALSGFRSERRSIA